MKKILVISTAAQEIPRLRDALRPDYLVAGVRDIESGLAALKKIRSDILFIDLAAFRDHGSGISFRTTFHEFWMLYPSLEIIILCRPDQLRRAVEAVRAGANTYLTFPMNIEEARLVLENLSDYLRMEQELNYLRRQFWDPGDLDFVQTRCPAMHDVFEKVRSVAPTSSTVLITGETGTGKSVMAHLIHRHSPRRSGPFIKVHCGAIPDSLLESELFGHEKGAFTGADRRRLGKFEIAGGGSVFLDEIGTMSSSAQIKLLQMLQDRTFQRLGGTETFTADVRIIAATNADLRALCEEGRFRRDLYYRMNVFPIDIPPLRERIDDIPFLTQSLIKKLNRLHQKSIRDIRPSVLEAFQEYSWPGNIRELENLLERAFILEPSRELSPASFPSELFSGPEIVPGPDGEGGTSLSEMRKRGVEELERRYLDRLLQMHRGRIQPAAETAGITTRRLRALLTKYHIRKEQYKNRTGGD